MLLTKEVFVKIVPKNLSYYTNLGYVINYKDIITISPIQLPKGSAKKVMCQCDTCQRTYEIKYYNYVLNIEKNNGIVICHKCCQEKKESTCIKNYGVKNISQSEDVKRKKEKTFLKNFNIKNIFEDVTFIQKKLQEKYNVINSSQLSWVQNKIRKTNLQKFGVEYSLQSEKIKEKSKKTNMLKYGVEYPGQSKEIQKKILNTKVAKGNAIDPILLTDFQIYRKKVDKVTKQFKVQLFKTWSGYDYYDEEYIKENIKKHYNNQSYPTIDHKISIFYGFQNNILPSIIGNITNLCITKRVINIKKNKKIESTFLNHPLS